MPDEFTQGFRIVCVRKCGFSLPRLSLCIRPIEFFPWKVLEQGTTQTVQMLKLSWKTYIYKRETDVDISDLQTHFTLHFSHPSIPFYRNSVTMASFDASNLFSVKGMVYVITGGGSGLGETMALALNANGASKVFILGRREASLKKVAAQAVSLIAFSSK